MLNSFYFASSVSIPVGIIIPFIGAAASIPSGWSQFTAGNDRAIKGHNTTAGITGGSTSVSGVSGTSHNGDHTGPAVGIWLSIAGGSGADLRDSGGQGGHSHSVTLTYEPAKRKQVMMKSTIEHQQFPINSGVLSSTVRADLTDVTPTGKFLYGTSGSSSTDTTTSISTGTSAAGTHAHNSGTGNGAGTTTSTNVYAYQAGGHDHSLSPSVTDKQKKIWLGLYQAASVAIPPASGMYALWESSVAPEGWSICDGTGGTPNLTGYFIGFDVSKIGTTEGTGAIDFSASISGHGDHSHISGTLTRAQNSAYHSSYTMDNHSSLSQANIAYEMPSYTLVIIRYKG